LKYLGTVLKGDIRCPDGQLYDQLSKCHRCCLDKITCVYRCCFIGDSTIQSDVRRFYTAFKTKVFGSVPAVWTIESSCPDAHLTTVPSVWTTYHTVQTPVRPSIIRSDDVHFPFGPLLYREATVPACIRSDVSVARSDASQ